MLWLEARQSLSVMNFCPDKAISSRLPINCCCCFSYSFNSSLCTLSISLVGWLFDWDRYKILDSGSGYGASEDRLMYVIPGDKFCCQSSWQNEIWCPPGPAAHVSLNSISSDLQYLLDIKLPVSLVLANKQGDLQDELSRLLSGYRASLYHRPLWVGFWEFWAVSVYVQEHLKFFASLWCQKKQFEITVDWIIS